MNQKIRVARLPNYILHSLAEMEFDERQYQALATELVSRELDKGRSAQLILPPGVGKTLISQMVALRWLRSAKGKGKKVVYILPGRLLLDQHFEYGLWLANFIRPFRLDSRATRSFVSLERDFLGSDVIFTTPELLWNCIHNGDLSIDRVRDIGLVVIDEFDEFVKMHISRRGRSARFRKDIAQLLPLLAQTQSKFLLTSATPHGIDDDTMGKDPRTQLVEDLLCPRYVDVPENLYWEFVPVVRVYWVPIRDDDVSLADTAIAQLIAENIEYLQGRVTQETIRTGKATNHAYRIRRRDLIEQLQGIVSGREKFLHIFYHNRPILSIPLDSGILIACRIIQSAIHARLFLFEDMFEGIEVEVIVSNVSRYCLVRDNPSTRDYHVELKLKATMASQLVHKNKRRRGVIFCRNIELVDALADEIRQTSIKCTVVHGDLDDIQRRQAIEEYRRGESNVLLVTRRTGGRGFDIPEADYAIFYSPKEEERTMWQEVLRIRSMRRHVKNVYVLFYKNTAEEAKKARLEVQMSEKGSSYRLRTMGIMT